MNPPNTVACLGGVHTKTRHSTNVNSSARSA